MQNHSEPTVEEIMESANRHFPEYRLLTHRDEILPTDQFKHPRLGWVTLTSLAAQDAVADGWQVRRKLPKYPIAPFTW